MITHQFDVRNTYNFTNKNDINYPNRAQDFYTDLVFYGKNAEYNNEPFSKEIKFDYSNKYSRIKDIIKKMGDMLNISSKYIGLYVLNSKYKFDQIKISTVEVLFNNYVDIIQILNYFYIKNEICNIKLVDRLYVDSIYNNAFSALSEDDMKLEEIDINIRILNKYGCNTNCNDYLGECMYYLSGKYYIRL